MLLVGFLGGVSGAGANVGGGGVGIDSDRIYVGGLRSISLGRDVTAVQKLHC